MPFRQIQLPSLRCRLSNVIACPSSAEPDSHESGLEEYHRLGGNCIHMHGEGGEIHSRKAVGQWLQRRRFRSDFFLCVQICHEGWDPVARCDIDRLTPDAVATDVTADLDLIGTDYLDFVYVANFPGESLGPFMDAVAREMASGRVRGFGVRNWTAENIQEAQAHAARTGTPRITAVVTTELALATAVCPLWPQDIPFRQLEPVIRNLGLAVFAHADSYNLGQYLFDGGKDQVPHRWTQRWESPANRALALRVRQLAAKRALTPLEINLAWLLNQRLPVVGLLSLPGLLAGRSIQIERASQLVLTNPDLASLSPPDRPM